MLGSSHMCYAVELRSGPAHHSRFSRLAPPCDLLMSQACFSADARCLHRLVVVARKPIVASLPAAVCCCMPIPHSPCLLFAWSEGLLSIRTAFGCCIICVGVGLAGLRFKPASWPHPTSEASSGRPLRASGETRTLAICMAFLVCLPRAPFGQRCIVVSTAGQITLIASISVATRFAHHGPCGRRKGVGWPAVGAHSRPGIRS